MSHAGGQSTDAENSKSMYKASKPGDDLKGSSMSSVQVLASTPKEVIRSAAPDAVTAPLAAGDQ